MMSRNIGGDFVGHIYDDQNTAYTSFAEQSYSWRFIEKPAFDRLIPDLLTASARVLDIGCGTGRSIQYLIDRGVAPENIVGIDVSEELLKIARERFPNVTFYLMSFDMLDFAPASFDLVTSNMVLQYIDNTMLESGLARIYDILAPNGTFFFVCTDPDHNEISRKNVNTWQMQITPWGTSVPVFARDPRELLTHYIDLAGFDYVAGGQLKVERSEEAMEDVENFTKYTSYLSRIAARYIKVSQRIKDERNDPDWHIQSLADE